jgi:hypothetical protein
MSNDTPHSQASTDTTMAADLHHLVHAELGIQGPISVVGHDLGSMLGFAYALRYRDDVVSLTTMEAPLPGTDYYEQRKVAKSAWHFDFHANPDIAVYLTHAAHGKLTVPVLASGGGAQTLAANYVPMCEDCMERLWYESNGADPFPSARLTGTPFGNQVSSNSCRTRIIPEDRRSNDVSGFVEANHAVLLGSDRNAVHVVDSARRLDRLAEGRPPDVRVHLGAMGMRGASVPDQCSGLQVVYHDLAGLS